MGQAILKGILAAGLLPPEAIAIGNPGQEHCRYLQETYGVQAYTDNAQAVEGADMVIYAVKPQVAPQALTEELAGHYKPGACILSIMASVDLARLAAYAPGHPIIRVMPNTPLAVGAGMTALCAAPAVGPAWRKLAEAIFQASGETVWVEEGQIDAVSALSGCGPGYFFVIIDALADAGVEAGLSRDLAIKLAAQTAAGSGRLCLATGRHPALLRDQVTSPGGTTIAGLHALENHGLRGAFYDAVQAVLRRTKELQGK